MSKENLEQFMVQVAESEALQTAIGEEIDAEALIALGAECGCEFTAEEIQEIITLTDEELDGVAGGVSGFAGFDDIGVSSINSVYFNEPGSNVKAKIGVRNLIWDSQDGDMSE